MKLVPTLVLLYAILFAILIFDNTGSTGYYIDSYSGQLYTNGTDATSNSIWAFFVNPTIFSGNSFWIALAIVFSASAIGIVLTIATKSDMFILYPVFIIILMAGLIPIMAFWNVIDREVFAIVNQGGACLCTNPDVAACASSCPIAIIAAAIICGPIVIYWVFCCLEWLTARPVS